LRPGLLGLGLGIGPASPTFPKSHPKERDWFHAPLATDELRSRTAVQAEVWQAVHGHAHFPNENDSRQPGQQCDELIQRLDPSFNFTRHNLDPTVPARNNVPVDCAVVDRGNIMGGVNPVGQSTRHQ
jgi:hypothetical protein